MILLRKIIVWRLVIIIAIYLLILGLPRIHRIIYMHVLDLLVRLIYLPSFQELDFDVFNKYYSLLLLFS